MSALARWCYQHRFVVIIVWIGLLIGLAVMSQAVKTTYDNSLTLPGTGSGSAQKLLQRSAPAQAGDADQIVWRTSRGSVTDPAIEQRMSAMLARVSHLPEVASVASPYSPGGKVQVSADGRTAYATVNFTKAADDLDHADIKRVIATATAAHEPGLAVELGGKAISNTEQAPPSTMSAIGIGAAAVILLIAFGSLLAMALPIVTAVVGVSMGLMLMAPLSHLMSVNGIAPILGALIGLGVGVDYALFIVTRYRRALQSGLDPQQSAVQALNTSGRAVLFAGGTVCIALLGLLTLDLSFIDGLAVPAAITVVCTVVAAVTLLPALFGVLGLRVLSRRQRRRSRTVGPDHAESGSGIWARWSRTVPRFPAVLAAAGLAVMVVVSAPVLHLRLGFDDASNDPTSTHTHKSYGMLAKGFGPGFNGPLLVVAQPHSAADRAALEQLQHALTAVPGVAAVQTGPAQTRPGAGPAVEVTQVLPTTAPETPATSSLITHLRSTVIPRYTHGTTLRVYVGGLTATLDDFASVTSAKLPWFLATIVGFSFLLLVLAFRSLLIPALTAVLNLLAAAASFGVLTAFFQWGWGTSVFGLGSASPVEGYLPELVLAVLFGLSMDYQVFLVSRMAEEWSHTRDNTRSVLAGQTDTARVITAAAAIMIAVFTAFVFMGQRSIAEFGIGLAAGVALDAFILRTVLVPAVMHLCGQANWWLPRWLDRRLPHLAIEPAMEEQPVRAPESALV
ncbi:MMPL family transporter [Actinoallomurus iriomotensis]|uniref:Membrane protein n=1 Tax=Actinoallomurus iriomotensis TaxID=478107 RepID=A0A9W6RME6_9ACTN|nr:MMPL family transporter [Actinoallomurus iriomotensis]GLY78424.1 membrane protein [Actinoallomurus iriomotensis]